MKPLFHVNINPFETLFPTRYSPFSEILKRNFLGKLTDTFFMLFGKFTNITMNSLGIVDYLSLGILTLPVIFWNKTASTKSSLEPLAIFLLIPALLIRLTIASILFIPLLPILAITHPASSYLSKKYFQRALSLEIQTESETTKTLNQVLEDIHNAHPSINKHCMLHENCLSPSNINYHRIGEHFTEAGFQIPENMPATKPQQNAMKALLKLNLFGYTKALETHRDPILKDLKR